MFPEHDPNDPSTPEALQGVSLAGLALFIVISVWIATGAYYAVHYIYHNLPARTFVIPNARN